MKTLVLKEVDIIKPPFEGSVAEMVEWVKPVTVSVKGHRIAGGLLIHPTLLTTTAVINAGVVRVQFPEDDHETKARLSDYEGDHFLNGYILEEEVPDWKGLPNRTDPVTKDTYLFSYVHQKRQDLVVRYQAVPITESVAFREKEESENGLLALTDFERKNSYPVVDLYGYFVGLAIGISHEEVMCEIFQPNGGKL